MADRERQRLDDFESDDEEDEDEDEQQPLDSEEDEDEEDEDEEELLDKPRRKKKRFNPFIEEEAAVDDDDDDDIEGVDDLDNDLLLDEDGPELDAAAQVCAALALMSPCSCRNHLWTMPNTEISTGESGPRKTSTPKSWPPGSRKDTAGPPLPRTRATWNTCPSVCLSQV